MRIRPYFHDSTLPLLVEPRESGEASPRMLCEWLQAEGAAFDRYLHRHGAVLLRSFAVDDIEAFQQLARTIAPDLKPYAGGDSPRIAVADKVYTSTEFPPEQEIALHNELTYSGWWPRRVFFHCRTPSRTGGQTQIADARAVYAEIDVAVRTPFEEKGVSYLRNYYDRGGAGKSWQQSFETEERSEVEAFCAEAGMTCEWTRWGLRTRTTGAGVVAHPVTGERAWINQADQFHAAFDTPWQGSYDPASFDADTQPFHATFGDGTPIDLDALHEIRRAGRACEVLFDWQAGDVLVLDNILAMHGRKPFTGERQVLVAMA